MEQNPAQNQAKKAPVVSNGLFGGEDLRDAPADDGKSKLNSLFDYEDSDDEKNKQVQE